MLRPFVLIGVGGSGGKTLRIVRKELSSRLQQAGWDGDFPAGWQFLHVDVPSHADGNDPDLPEQLPTADYAGLVAAGLTYRTIDGALVGTGRTRVADSMAGWRPDPNKVNVAVEKGAGQFRALGRMITVANLKEVKRGIDSSIRDLTGAEVSGELQEISRLLEGKASQGPIPSPVAVVISSIAGGSGAGAVIDVCDTLRATGATWASESMGILYAPDVFDYLAEQRRRGVRPNALATLAELVAGYWNSDGPSVQTRLLLDKQGVAAGDADRLGPRYSFLVGSRNEFVSFATQNDVYRAMGRSIASWISSAVVQDRIEAYTQGNWQQAATSVPDYLPLKTTDMETPFTAIGSARVGMGRDRFRDYASERLARLAVETVLRRHNQDRSRDDDRTETAVVEEVAQRLFLRFLGEVQLNERSEEFNEIIDALRSNEGRKTTLKTLTGEITAAVSENSPDRGRSTREWRALILRRLDDGRPEFLDQRDVEHRESARAWVREVQTRLAQVVATHVAREGAPVTKELLTKLESELDFVRIELDQESLKLRRNAADYAQHVDQELQSAGGDLLKAEHPAIKMAVARGVQALDWMSEAALRDMAVDLIPDLSSNVVAPMRDALTRAHNDLARQESTSGGEPSQTARWPEGDIVPQDYLAAPNEFLIDATEDYPRMFDEIIRRTIGSGSAGTDIREAVIQVVVGSDQSEEQNLIEHMQEWVPERTGLHVSATETAARARFEFRLGAKEVLARSQGWVVQPGTAIAKFVQEGLRSYLDAEKADPEDLSRRLTRFEAQLGAALDAARPLVSINKAALVQVHHRNEIPSDVYPTEIPFPVNSEGRKIVQRVFETKGLWNAQVEQSVTDSPVGHIDLFSVLNEPYEPVVFDSLMRPIAEEWGVRSKTPDLRQEFWRWRRSRPLAEFIPVAPAIRRAMIRGWFTASLLGQIRLDAGTAEIYISSQTGGSGQWGAFPEPLLVDNIVAQHQYLPAVLQSLPIALIEVSAQADLRPVDPYRQLRDLGEGEGGGYDTYADPPKPYQSGYTKVASPLVHQRPRARWLGRADDDWATRQSRIESRFVELKSTYVDRLFAQVERRDDPLDVPLAYELRDDILAAFDDLIRAVRHMESNEEESSTWN